ncbi:MAG: MATE family efflux transporter [Myxococcales bacterium]|nr:MATE family efflux transporter [Myxococcales bacterium]
MSASLPDAAATGGRRRELRALWRLALPLAAGHAGNQMMSFVDTAMVGRLGAEALAGVAIGNGIFFTLTILGFGCVLGMDPLVSQALGAGEDERARRLLGQGLRVAVMLGLPLAVLSAIAPYALPFAGVDAATAHEAQRFVLGRAPSAIPFLLFAAQRSYLQARGATRAILLGTVLSNGINFIGNALLIYGDQTLVRLGLPACGLPALGVIGSGISSTVALVFLVAFLGFAIRALHGPTERGVRRSDPALQARILSFGFPLGLQFLAEVGVFALAGVLAGRMSARAAAGHQVAITLASLSFCVSLGIGAATSVRVGLHIGQGDTPGARRSGQLGLVSAAAFMSCSALVFLLLPGALARLLTDDSGVIAAAVPLVMIAAVFQISDGTQAVAAGALRGAGDTRVSLIANVICHYGIGLPIAIGLGFGAGMGAPGLWWGLTAGLTAVAIGLTARFLRLSSRAIRRA